MTKTLTDPVQQNERIRTIDILRGFALFGVLVVNFGVGVPANNTSNNFINVADQVIGWFANFFMTKKFISIFSFLFGLGFAIQLIRAEQRKTSFVPLYFRRLFVLYLFGVVNFIFTDGDILQEYAMAGVLLLLLYKLPLKWLPIIAILYVLIPRVVDYIIDGEKHQELQAQRASKVVVDNSIIENYAGVYEMKNGSMHILTTKDDTLFGESPTARYYLIPQSDSVFIRSDRPMVYTFRNGNNGELSFKVELPNVAPSEGKRISTDVQKALAERNQRRNQGLPIKPKGPQTYNELIKKNKDTYIEGWKNWSFSKFLLGLDITLPLFLIGLYIGRQNIFQNVTANKAFLKKATIWCFIFGLLGTAISTGFTAWNYYTTIPRTSYKYLVISFVDLSWMVGLMSLGLAYVGFLILLLEKGKWKKRLSFLAPVGQMGLTNYLLQSLAVTLTFNAFALNMGDAGPFVCFLLAIPYFLFFIIWSQWWFKNFAFGPAEWLWRSITYLKVQPIKPTKHKDVNIVK